MAPSLQEVLVNGERYINPNFRSWVPYAKTCSDLFYFDKGNYNSDVQKSFLTDCEEHEKKHARGITNNMLVVLTHPFYVSLQHYEFIDNPDLRGELKSYAQKLSKLFKYPREGIFDLVVLEAPNHYISLTSSLLEEGVVDRVLFTKYDEGHPIKEKGFSYLADHEIFFGGCYNQSCVSHSILDAHRLMVPKIWGIQDLVLVSPQTENSIRADYVCVVPDSRTITLGGFFRKLNYRMRSGSLKLQQN